MKLFTKHRYKIGDRVTIINPDKDRIGKHVKDELFIIVSLLGNNEGYHYLIISPRTMSQYSVSDSNLKLAKCIKAYGYKSNDEYKWTSVQSDIKSLGTPCPELDFVKYI